MKCYQPLFLSLGIYEDMWPEEEVSVPIIAELSRAADGAEISNQIPALTGV